jgi:hypothetical protein
MTELLTSKEFMTRAWDVFLTDPPVLDYSKSTLFELLRLRDFVYAP